MNQTSPASASSGGELGRAAAAGLLAAVLVATGWVILSARGAAAAWRSVAPLADASSVGLYLAASAMGALVAWVARPHVRDRDLGSWTSALVLVALTGFAHPLGRHAAMIALSATVAYVGASRRLDRPLARLRLARADRVLPVASYALTLVPMCIFPMHRHWSFGSGSWDMGCVVHNAYLVSRFLPTTSTVLGGPSFLGDHFSVGLYLYAPYFWLAGSGYGLLLLQAANLAVTAPAIYGIARRHGASTSSSFALAWSTGLSFGLQSAAFFDVHHITLGFGFFAAALWAIETRRLALASVLLFIFALFKESIGLYVVGLGAWLVLRSWRGSRRDRTMGAAWMLGGAFWFILVTRLFMPWFASRGAAPESHETYGDFGATVFEAAISILSQPLTAFWFMFVGDEKLMSSFTTLANAGWLTLLSPSVFVAAGPLLAERFLSSKASMWHMGFHYAAPLALYAGWGAARALGRTERWLHDRLGSGWFAPRRAVALFVLAMATLTLVYGYRHPANFLRWRYSYYSSPEKREANAAAVEWLKARAPKGRVAAQNHLLPHVAHRQHIYRLEDYAKADWVLLSLREDAWPYPRSHPVNLARRLSADPTWRLVLDESGARIYQRVGPSAGTEGQPE